MTPVTVYAASKESLDIPIIVTADPTATPPQFALSATGATAPGAFTTGVWSTAWSTVTTRATATTALVGSAGAHVIASGVDYDVWAKVTVGSEIAVWVVGRIHCP